MNLIELELSIRTIDILQKAGIWHIEDILEKLNTDPSGVTLALAKISHDDFAEITVALKKRTKNVLDNP